MKFVIRVLQKNWYAHFILDHIIPNNYAFPAPVNLKLGVGVCVLKIQVFLQVTLFELATLKMGRHHTPLTRQ